MNPGEIQFWKIASADLGLEVVSPFELTLPGGNTLVAAALVRNFGPPMGMVVSADFDLLRPHTATLRERGYGYSSGFGRSPDEYERDGLIEVLKDWCWSGTADKRPDWLG